MGEPGEYTIKEVPDTGLCETEHQREVPDHTAGGGVAKGGRSSGGSGFFPEEVIHHLVERQAKSAR